MNIITCLDLEGVLLPEIWHMCAVHTGIEELKLSTRDIADYDQLMDIRISALRRHQVPFHELIKLITQYIEPLEGATEFLSWLAARHNPVIVTDSFTQFLTPLRAQLGNPVLLCNELEMDEEGYIIKHRMRIPQNGKRYTVESFKAMGCKVAAVGDSYNDIEMLEAAELGILFRAPQKILSEYAHFSACTQYSELWELLVSFE